METKEKVLHYRRADFLQPDTPLTLQEMVKQALRQKNTIGARKENINHIAQQIGGWSRFINTHLSAHGMEFGVLVLVEPGQSKLLIESIENKDLVDITQIPPPVGKEFMESYLCYGIKDDHVIILQSVGLRISHLETHLFWLLGANCSGIVDAENGVFLSDYAPQEAYDIAENNRIDNVSLHVPLGSTENTDIQSDHTSSEVATDITQRVNVDNAFFNAGAHGLSVLKALFPSDRVDTIIDSLDTEGVKTELEIFVQVKRKRRTTEINESSQEVLNTIARTMRNIDSDEVKIQLDNGTTLSGNKLTVKSTKTFSHVNGILDPNDVFLKMSNWLRELINGETIIR